MPNRNQSFLPLRTLELTFLGRALAAVDGYWRDLDLDTGTAGVRFRYDGVTMRREAFGSAIDAVVVVHLAAETAGQIGFGARLRRA